MANLKAEVASIEDQEITSIEEQEADELIHFLSEWGAKYGYRIIVPDDEEAIVNDVMIDGTNKRIIFGEISEEQLSELEEEED